MLVSQLDRAIRQNRKDKIDAIIRFLEHYVKDHFKEEEDLMQRHRFDGYDFHKSEHEIFKVRVKELRQRYTDNNPVPHIVFAVRQFIDRLIEHITTVDSEMAGITGGNKQ